MNARSKSHALEAVFPLRAFYIASHLVFRIIETSDLISKPAPQTGKLSLGAGIVSSVAKASYAMLASYSGVTLSPGCSLFISNPDC